MSDDPLIPWLQAEIARLLDVPPDHVPADAQLMQLGLDSLAATRLCGAISDKVGFEVDTEVVYDYPTIAEFAAHLQSLRAQPT